MRILQISTRGVRCGIAHYTDVLARSLNEDGRATCDIHPLDQDKIQASQNLRELDAYFASLLPEAKKYDFVHIQHEYSFFGSGRHGVTAANFALGNFLRLLGRAGIRPAVTFHSDPHAVAQPRFKFTFRPHKLVYRLHRRHEDRAANRRLGEAFAAFPSAAVAHNAFSAESLHAEHFIPKDRIHRLNLAVQKRTVSCTPARRLEIRERVSRDLNLGAGDILVGLVGFISEYKGHLEALRALHLLPPHYKLLVIGGKHPRDASPFFDRMLQLVHELRLESRVHVTDTFEDEDLDAYFELTHVLAAPYADHFRSSSAALTLGLCSGRPLVASAIKPFLEINQESPCLELHAPHAFHELAYRIRRVAENPTLSARLVAAAAVYTQANSPRAIAARHLDLFASLKANSS